MSIVRFIALSGSGGLVSLLAVLALRNSELLPLQGQQAFYDKPSFRIGLACEQILEMGDICASNESVHDIPQRPDGTIKSTLLSTLWQSQLF
jgi:hypothetical protein